YQTNRNVLLTDDATMHSKPELEIYADDVSCSHGSTTGQLDEDALFYLRARGIPFDKAQHLVIHAFVSEVLSKIENENTRTFFEEKVSETFESIN
ncbi:MAG: SufD family Fe-S cluster assembly protein, partial [Flavobacteriales bacterium]